MKEYNAKRHYTTKHSIQLDEILGQTRMDTIEYLKKSIKKQQGVFTSDKKDSELVTKLSFKLCESMAEKGKPFGEVELIKKLTVFIEYACPEKKHSVKHTRLYSLYYSFIH